MLSLPYSKKKRYLSGIDWIIYALNHLTLEMTGAGNMSQIVMEIPDSFPVDKFKVLLTHIAHQYPVVFGTPKRDFNLAPYWKFPSIFENMMFLWKSRTIEKHEALMPTLESYINTPFPSAHDHIGFLYLKTPEHTYLTMKFDHRLLDAQGAEKFLELLERAWQTPQKKKTRKIFAHPAHLDNWPEKFKSGQIVNRKMLSLALNRTPRVLPLSWVKKKKFRYHIIEFSQVETRKIFQNAQQTAGLFMEMPFLLATTIKIIHLIFNLKNIPPNDLVIPVNIDARKKNQTTPDIFFNHVSFFLFQIKQDHADDWKIILDTIKKQLYEQVKSNLADHIHNASQLMRICPLPIMSHLMRVHLKGQLGSFCFSYINDPAFNGPSLLGTKILRRFHMPRVPVPPGIGFFFYHHNNQLQLFISYLDGLLTDFENSLIEDAFKKCLVLP